MPFNLRTRALVTLAELFGVVYHDAAFLIQRIFRTLSARQHT